MYEQTFKNIDDILRKDAGCDSEIDYIEQTSWILFLKYLNDLENEKADEAALKGEDYEYILDEKYQWDVWAAPKDEDGELDHKEAVTGPDLVEFVDDELFPYLSQFRQQHIDSPKTIEYKIGEIFSGLENKLHSGYIMRDVINHVDELPFMSAEDKHELSHLYETKIKDMGNAGRSGGQYYTPRPLIRAMIDVIDPQVGETVYDGAAGSAGFLCEAYEYMYERMEKTTENLHTLQKDTFFGKEKKNLAYIIGTMNMILHGIEAPNILRTNTLSEDVRQIQEKDRHDIILANPPFGGKERKEVQQNFDIKTSETAFLFLQHFIRSLKAGGRAAVVIKNTFLSNSDNATVSLRKYLLETCKLHTILNMPGGTFLGAGVKTVILFFEKGEPTKNIWYYDFSPERSLGKTDPLNDRDLSEFIELQKEKPETEQSWNVDIADISTDNYDMSVRNPNKNDTKVIGSPNKILKEFKSLNEEVEVLLNEIEELNLEAQLSKNGEPYSIKKIKDVCEVIPGQSPKSKYYNTEGEGLPFYQGKKRFTEKYIDSPVKWTTQVKKEAIEGDILMSVRAPVGPVNFATQKICIGRGLTAIRANKDKIDPEYLFNFLLKHESEIISNEGAVFNSINSKQIRNIQLPVPSLQEQKRIVSILNRFQEKRAELSKILNKKTSRIGDLNNSTLRKAFNVEIYDKEELTI